MKEDTYDKYDNRRWYIYFKEMEVKKRIDKIKKIQDKLNDK